MAAPIPSRPGYRFGDFEFDPRSGELRKRGLRVKLREQPGQILTLLLARPGELVTREEARGALWPGRTFVDFDVGLNSAIKRLRAALDDSAEAPRFVETLPRRGYRFIAAVEAPAVPIPVAPEVPVPPAEGGRPRRRAAAAIVVAGLLGGLIVSGTWMWRRGQPPPLPIRSLAVLPFENLSADPAQDYFADGVTDALTTELAQIRALRVISRTSAVRYKGAKKPLSQIVQELGVDAVVEGAVARSGGRVRVTAQLIHAPTDAHLWAHSYERELRDVLVLQREVAAAIASAIQVELRPVEKRRLERGEAVHPEAYEAYLKGRFYWSKRSPEDLLRAVTYFQQAIEKDPGYAPAYSGLSDAYRLFDLEGLAPPRECMPKAETAARKALALDDTLAEAHASLAGVLYRYQWQWDAAEKEFQRSLELDPNSAEGHRAYAVYLMTVRRHEDALVEARQARTLSPLSPVINVELATALVRVGRYDEAIERLHHTLEIDPRFPRAYVGLAAAHEGKGDRARAVSDLEKSAALSPHSPNPWLGYAYGVTGRRSEAVKILSELEKHSRQRYVSPQSFAVVHLGLGDKDRALGLLEKAYEERSFEVLGFSGGLFDRLHDEPRFQDLRRRMGLPVAGGRTSVQAHPAPNGPTSR
jgi:TolB-like protein/DNA-binding winged helix-turn-helix (wHTH) protein/Flp pilus assembly protein TadD